MSDIDLGKYINELLNSAPIESSIDTNNIFAILNKERDERTHCRILRYLIEKYWDSFKKYVLCNVFKIEENSIGDMSICVCEKHIERLLNCEEDKNGSIDIFIETDNYIIPIEVKVDAGDQKMQLLRYYNYYCSNNKGKKLCLAYITPTGKNASSYSLKCTNIKSSQCSDCKFYKGIAESVDKYFPIGYCIIENWLNIIIDSEKNNGDNLYIAKCYKEILEKEREQMEIVNKILSNEQNYNRDEKIKRFKAAAEIYSAYQKAIEDIKKAFFEALKDRFKDEKYLILKPEKTDDAILKNTTDYKNTVFFVYENNKLLFSVCVGANLYMRLFNNDDNEPKWAYITTEWFKKDNLTEYFIDVKDNKRENIINALNLSNDNNAIINWYFSCKDDQDAQMENLEKHIITAVENKLKITHNA